MDTLLEALSALNTINESEGPTKEEIVAKAERAKELYFAEKERLLSEIVGLCYGEGLYKIKGEIKSADIYEERREVRERDPFNYLYHSVWKDALVNELTCVKNHNGSEFKTTIEELGVEGFEFFKQGSYGKQPFKLSARWNNLVGLFNSYKKWSREAAVVKAKDNKVTPTRRTPFNIETFNPYKDPTPKGSAWREIKQHPDWIQWIEDYAYKITARAPETDGKLEQARRAFGHDKIYPANTWGWSFSIAFDHKKAEEDGRPCPFPHLLSTWGTLCSVHTVCALFKGPSYEDMFATPKSERIADDEIENVEDVEESEEPVEAGV